MRSDAVLRLVCAIVSNLNGYFEDDAEIVRRAERLADALGIPDDRKFKSEDVSSVSPSKKP